MSDVTMLLVDDDVIDRKAVTRVFKQVEVESKIVEASDGLEALRILRGEHDEKVIGGNFLILLDLSMPRMDGIEFLDEVRRDPALKSSIVFVLTTSASDEDKSAAYQKQIAGYIVKSSFSEGFVDVVRMIDQYKRVIEFP